MAVNKENLPVNPFLLKKAPCKPVNKISAKIMLGRLTQMVPQCYFIRERLRPMSNPNSVALTSLSASMEGIPWVML